MNVYQICNKLCYLSFYKKNIYITLECLFECLFLKDKISINGKSRMLKTAGLYR